MPWTDGSGPPPHRSEHELRALVQAKAGRIRRRRIVASSAVAVACVAAVLVGAVAVVARDSQDTAALHVTGPAPDPSVVVDTTVMSPSTTVQLEPATSTTLPGPPSTVRSVPPTTVVPGTTTTRPATTVAPSTTTSTTALAVLPMCAPSEVLVTATTDKAVYGPSDTVTFAIAAENRSAHVCQPLDPSLEIRDAAGRSLGGGGWADIFTMGVPGQPPPRWEAGQILRTSLPWTLRCPPTDGPCPPGTYTAIASFGPLRSAPAEFRVA